MSFGGAPIATIGTIAASARTSARAISATSSTYAQALHRPPGSGCRRSAARPAKHRRRDPACAPRSVAPGRVRAANAPPAHRTEARAAHRRADLRLNADARPHPPDTPCSGAASTRSVSPIRRVAPCPPSSGIRIAVVAWRVLGRDDLPGDVADPSPAPERSSRPPRLRRIVFLEADPRARRRVRSSGCCSSPVTSPGEAGVGFTGRVPAARARAVLVHEARARRPGAALELGAAILPRPGRLDLRVSFGSET